MAGHRAPVKVAANRPAGKEAHGEADIHWSMKLCTAATSASVVGVRRGPSPISNFGGGIGRVGRRRERRRP